MPRAPRAVIRGKAGRFITSGNPAGRPRGIPDRRSALRAMLENEKEGIINTLVRLAKRGDATALRLVTERLIPALRPTSEMVTIDLPEGTLSQKCEAILNCAVMGELPLTEARDLCKVLLGNAELINQETFEKRIADLEDKMLHVRKGDELYE